MALRLSGTDLIGANELNKSRILEASQMPAGTVLQVIQSSTYQSVHSSSSSWVSLGLTGTIKPCAPSSKVWILVNAPILLNSGISSDVNVTIFRGSISGTELSGRDRGFVDASGGTNNSFLATHCLNYLDNPNTNTDQIYTVAAKIIQAGSASFDFCYNGSTLATMTLIEIAG